MIEKFFTAVSLILLLAISSCSRDSVLNQLEQIKHKGDTNPVAAMTMLDSLEAQMQNQGKHVKAKYDLLRIRLNDKADVMPTSDLAVDRLVKYFDRHGSALEKQEVHYYAGSVYRDLQDTPRSLTHFFQSIQSAEEGGECDTTMLRNTYSNLQYLHYRVQNYSDALDMARHELALSVQLHDDLVLPYMHMGSSLVGLDSLAQAEKAFDQAFGQIMNSKDVSAYQQALEHLLCQYADLGNMTKARKVREKITADPLQAYNAFSCIAFAQYFERLGVMDSAMACCERVLAEGDDPYNIYDASKLLYRISDGRGDIAKANEYARLFIHLSDSIDLGERQKLAATVNNEYKYYQDQDREQRLREENARYWNMLAGTVLVAVFCFCLGYILYVRHRNRHLQICMQLETELKQVSGHERMLRAELSESEERVASYKQKLEDNSTELDSVKQSLDRVEQELRENKEKLKDREQLLEDKIEQNKTFMRLLCQSEMSVKATEFINMLRQSSGSTKEMQLSDWKKLYQAIDELYPDFKERLFCQPGVITEQQMQVCYLMRAGLSKPQILQLTKLSRVTVWRWTKKYEWILNPSGWKPVSE